MKNTVFFLLLTSFQPQAQWDIVKPLNEIPKTTLHGELMGHTFEIGEAKFEEHGLTLKSKEKHGDYWHTTTVTILGVRDDGYWEVLPSKSSLSIHKPTLVLHYFLKDHSGVQYSPARITIDGEYSMKLIIDKMDDNNYKGSLHLSLPDYRKSFLIGNFDISE